MSQAQRAAIIALALLLAMIGNLWAQSQPKPQPQSERSPLSEQQRPAQPAPAGDALTSQQIQQSITDGINAAAKQYEARHPTTPPDYSGWWFNFLLVVFTGVLAVVGGAQSFLIFWTLKATQTAAEAANESIKAVTVVERAYVYPVIVGHGVIGDCINTATVFFLGAPDKDDEPVPETAEVTFRFKNFGKTPAILKTAFAGVGVAPLGAQIGLPLVESVLGAGEETVTPLVSKMEIGITRTQAQHILAYTGHICFEGYVVFDDIWGNENKTEFYFVWDHWISRMNLRWVQTETKQKGEQSKKDS
jgi:hypothetical protein